MRTVILVCCALLITCFSVEAKKRIPASQKTTIAKQHRSSLKKIQKSRRVKHVRRNQAN